MVLTVYILPLTSTLPPPTCLQVRSYRVPRAALHRPPASTGDRPAGSTRALASTPRSSCHAYLASYSIESRLATLPCYPALLPCLATLPCYRESICHTPTSSPANSSRGPSPRSSQVRRAYSHRVRLLRRREAAVRYVSQATQRGDAGELQGLASLASHVATLNLTDDAWATRALDWQKSWQKSWEMRDARGVAGRPTPAAAGAVSEAGNAEGDLPTRRGRGGLQRALPSAEARGFLPRDLLPPRLQPRKGARA